VDVCGNTNSASRYAMQDAGRNTGVKSLFGDDYILSILDHSFRGEKGDIA
jgi:hypothetical protein